MVQRDSSYDMNIKGEVAKEGYDRFIVCDDIYFKEKSSAVIEWLHSKDLVD